MSHCTPPQPQRCGYCEEEILAQLPKWTVLYNIVSLEADAFVGTGWEFFALEDDASACYQRHIDVGNCPTKRPFNRKCDIPHLGAHHRYWIEREGVTV